MTQSRAPLREAAETFDALGLLRYAERSAPGGAGLGRTSSPPRRGRLGSTVAAGAPDPQLAAEGLSNREIGEQLYLSHRTVESHLYRLFPKLGVTSRAQLRDALEAAPHS